MADTPIDHALDVKTSTRYPQGLVDRIESFKAEYNDQMEESFDGSEATDTFTLDSLSEARRRLIDIGLRQYEQNGLPFGFAFTLDALADEGEFDDPGLRCPTCGETDAESFRVGASKVEGGVVFDTLRCEGCGESCDVGDAVEETASLL